MAIAEKTPTLTRPVLGVVDTQAPLAPRDVAATGLPIDFLRDLLGKILLMRGRQQIPQLADYVCLPRSVVLTVLEAMRQDQHVEITKGGATEIQSEYQQTDRGRIYAQEASARCGYAGPAPVTLEQYCDVVQAQSATQHSFDADKVRTAFSNVTLQDGIVDQIGAAMNSGRAILLYGPAGSGKTHLAELLTRIMDGSVMVPHAIFVAGDVIQVYDPLVHTLVKSEPASQSDKFVATLTHNAEDTRWLRCKRPMGLTGGELTLDMLDLQYNNATHFYQAPPHMKANGGVFVIDDLGRQLVGARELMNRWIVPLDRQQDYLALQNGFKFSVPFDLTVVFSTNLHPTELADEAFLRRFGYKIFVGELTPAQYREIMVQVCENSGVKFDADTFDWLLQDCHTVEERPLLACYPRDLLGRVKDFSTYTAQPAEMSRDALTRAWSTYFVQGKKEDDGIPLKTWS